MNEDVNTVSPTLGFIIKTIDHGGYVGESRAYAIIIAWANRLWRSYKLNICMLDSYLSLPSEGSALIEGRKPRGCGWPENTAFILEELLREDGCFDLGCRCNRPSTYRRLQGRACRFVTRRSQLTHDQQSTLYHLFFSRGHIYAHNSKAAHGSESSCFRQQDRRR